jgi:predicted RNase H-like HicB family nuclease
VADHQDDKGIACPSDSRLDACLANSLPHMKLRKPLPLSLPEADGGFTVVIPALGCATQGDTIKEAQANAVEAAEGWLTSQHQRRKDEAIRATP